MKPLLALTSLLLLAQPARAQFLTGSVVALPAQQVFFDPNAFADGTLFQFGQMPTGAGFTNGRNNNVVWPVPGVDFPVGVTPGTYCGSSGFPCSQSPGATNLIDAVAYFSAIATNGDPAGTGCETPGSAYSPSGHPGEIICKIGSANININGFDQTPTVSGAPTCTPITVTSSGGAVTAGTINHTNSRYLQTSNNPACLAPTGGAALRLGVSTAQAWAVNLNHDFIDLQSTQPYMLNVDVIAVEMQGAGTAVISNSVLANMPTKAVTTQNCATAFLNNVYHNDGWDYGHALHTEFFIINGIANCPAANQTINGALFWQDTTIPSPPEAYLADAVLGASTPDPVVGYPTVLTGDYENIVAVTNPTSDGNGNLSWYSEISGDNFPLTNSGLGYAVGDIVQVNVTYGAGAACRKPPTFIVETIGAGGSIASNQLRTAGSCLSGASPPNGSTVFSTTALTGLGSGATLLIATWSDATASAGIGFAGSGTLGVSGGVSYTNLIIRNIAMDLSGMLGCQTNASDCAAALNGHPGSIIYCANPATISNNFDLLNNNVLPAPTPTSGC